MSKRQRTASLLLASALAAAVTLIGAVGWAAKLIVDAGTFDRVWTHHPDLACRTHENLPGVEDLVRVPGTSLVLFATHTRVSKPGAAFSSGLFLYDAARQSERPVPQALPGGLKFAPHGLGYVADEDSEPASPRGLLHVVNHAGVEHGHGDAVEVFRHQGRTLTHLKTIRFPQFETINGVHPVSEGVFYFTSDFGSANPMMQGFEKYLRIPRGGVHLHDDGVTRTLDSGLFFGNGITASPDGGRLFVAEMLARRLRVYDIKRETGELQQRPMIPLNTAPDNIRFDDTGKLLVAAHPRLLELNAHSKNPFERAAPSQIVAVDGLLKGDVTIEEVLSDPGQAISAVSTALRFDGNLLMGFIYRDGLVQCTPK